jgi:PilZ domain
MNTEDRRAPGASRMPFDGLVEVGGALGPSFEAQAVNVSEDGMHLRTAYLPEQGQPLTCRFEAGSGQSVLASGEVVWSQGVEKGGEFGVRFTDMDVESVDSLKRICGIAVAADPPGAPPVHSGSKVRLHIDGLASPMRAKVRDAQGGAVTVGSDLSFLQVGRQLELEDAVNGNKRPANIDRVEVAVDPTSHVPQLVVTLRYSDVKSPAEGAQGWAPGASIPPAGDDLAAVEEASMKMKGALAHNLTKVGPAIERLAERAKTMVTLLAKRRREPSPVRRTTAPPPGGGLHASGRRVVRGVDGEPSRGRDGEPSRGRDGELSRPDASRGKEGSLPDDSLALPKGALFKRKAAVASAVMLAAVIGAIAIKKSHHDPASDLASAPAASASSATDVAPAQAAPAPAPEPMNSFPPAPAFPAPMSADDSVDPSKPNHKHHLHVAPFGNGPVHHGNVLRLKMDAAIESIEGAQQPTGFTVKIPGRKALEAAAPLAARDSRIAAIKVTNEGAGAELAVTFKDGVPNYQVGARGDTLVISLAPVGTLEDTMAKKDEKGGKSAKHGKHSHKTETF